MLDHLRQLWKDFKSARPGERFQNIHKKSQKQKRGPIDRRWALMILGVLLTLVGLFFLVAPGPGFIFLAPGLALLAAESLTLARWLDWLEPKLRQVLAWAKRLWHRANKLVKWSVASAAVLLLAGAAAAGYMMFIK